jgi:hypothetical protein
MLPSHRYLCEFIGSATLMHMLLTPHRYGVQIHWLCAVDACCLHSHGCVFHGFIGCGVPRRGRSPSEQDRPQGQLHGPRRRGSIAATPAGFVFRANSSRHPRVRALVGAVHSRLHRSTAAGTAMRERRLTSARISVDCFPGSRRSPAVAAQLDGVTEACN